MCVSYAMHVGHAVHISHAGIAIAVWLQISLHGHPGPALLFDSIPCSKVLVRDGQVLYGIAVCTIHLDSFTCATACPDRAVTSA